MPKEKQKKSLKVDDLRHAEYYAMQETFDELYAMSKEGKKFTSLMDVVLSRENILLAYRNIKANSGSKTAGTDNLTIKDIGCMTPDEMVERVRFIVMGSKHGYRPKAVRRKDIPKPYDPTKTRPLGIPCIWDRLVQQCLKQVMEPICEAKFSDNSYGFRPNRSVEHAIQSTYKMIQNTHLHYVIEFDIKGFFDNVNHSKLIKQIWAMGIQDKRLIYILKQILTAPIKMPNGSVVHPTKGTPQGGIISPLLANIVLNELDRWIESQWQSNPVARKYSVKINKNGSEDRGHGYEAMKRTKMKEMYIVRYADDFRVFCRTKNAALNTKIAITQWMSERLRLEVSQEKTRIVNVKRRYSVFLGFKIKAQKKGEKYVVTSHISDKQLERQRQKLVEQAKKVAKPKKGRTELDEIKLYNAMVMGCQNYYRIATNVSKDCSSLLRSVMTIFKNRLHNQRLKKTGRVLTPDEKKRYGKSNALRFMAGTGEPVYPIGYVQHKHPIAKKRAICSYTPEGRVGLHDNLKINKSLLYQLMRQPLYGRSVEYADNRISLFSAQWGKCAVTGHEFESLQEIHCHHLIPKSKGGSDKYENLVLVTEPVHRLIHATCREVIDKYLKLLGLNEQEIEKINSLRIKIGLAKLL